MSESDKEPVVDWIKSNLVVQPKYVGGWQIGGNQGLLVSVVKKPKWITRKLIGWLLEWEWKTYAK